MFGKKKNGQTPLVLSQEKFDTLIGRHAEIQGTLQLNESIRIDGRVLGNVQCVSEQPVSVVIGPAGEVVGDVVAQRGQRKRACCCDSTSIVPTWVAHPVRVCQGGVHAPRQVRDHREIRDIPPVFEDRVKHGFHGIAIAAGSGNPQISRRAIESRKVVSTMSADTAIP